MDAGTMAGAVFLGLVLGAGVGGAAGAAVVTGERIAQAFAQQEAAADGAVVATRRDALARIYGGAVAPSVSP